MQEEIEQKSFNLMISTTKLSARTVLNAVKAAIRLYQSKASQGKQSVRTLLRQNRGVSSVEISKTGIKGFERYAKKYGIDYAIRKDSSEVPPKYLVFFKAPDYEAPKEEQNFATLLEMLNTMQVSEDDEDFQNPVDLLFEDLARKKSNSFAGRQYKLYKLAAGDICSK